MNRLLVLVLLDCQSPEAKYTKDLSACEAAVTCADAVACRRDAAIKAGRDPNVVVGHCEGADGGAK